MSQDRYEFVSGTLFYDVVALSKVQLSLVEVKGYLASYMATHHSFKYFLCEEVSSSLGVCLVDLF